MTIGEKIRYCREQIGITQGKLAELTGIHPVSIRKYETNKMQPQPPQLEKIAAALSVILWAYLWFFVTPIFFRLPEKEAKIIY